jgi:hypothetical protein
MYCVILHMAAVHQGAICGEGVLLDHSFQKRLHILKVSASSCVAVPLINVSSTSLATTTTPPPRGGLQVSFCPVS